LARRKNGIGGDIEFEKGLRACTELPAMRIRHWFGLVTESYKMPHLAFALPRRASTKEIRASERFCALAAGQANAATHSRVKYIRKGCRIIAIE